MSRLNEIKKIRYKLRNTDSLELSKKDIEFLCDWAEKGIVAISKTEITSCGACSDDYVYQEDWHFCPKCGRRLT